MAWSSALAVIRRRAEYGFGEYGFKRRTQWGFFGPHWVPGRELSELLSAYYLCAKANSPSFSQNSPSLPQNSVSSLFRNSTLETVFRPFPSSSKKKSHPQNPAAHIKLVRMSNWIRRMSEIPTSTTSQKKTKYTSELYCNTPPICIAVLLVPLRSEEREILSVLLPFVS